MAPSRTATPTRSATHRERPGATVARDLDAPVPAVVAMLLRAEAFPAWVVGPGRVVSVDPSWPAIGAGFTHETGRGPFTLRDRTVLEHLDAEGGRIGLTAMLRPAGRARIQVHVTAREVGSRVVLYERPISGPGAWLPHRLYRPALTARNTIALRRLAALVRDQPQQGPRGSR